MRALDAELHNDGAGTRWIQTSARLTCLVYWLAEAFSYYNVATTNELWAAIEVATDALAYVVRALDGIHDGYFLVVERPDPYVTRYSTQPRYIVLAPAALALARTCPADAQVRHACAAPFF